MNQENAASRTDDVATIVIDAINNTDSMSPVTAQKLFVAIAERSGDADLTPAAQVQVGALLEGLYSKIEQAECA